jgi:hypothetical protein
LPIPRSRAGVSSFSGSARRGSVGLGTPQRGAQSVNETPSEPVDATYTTASEAELRRRIVEGDRNAKAELVRRSKQASESLPPEAEDLVAKLREENGGS